MVESNVTRSSSASPATPAPTAAIRPAASWPITIGGIRRPDDPSYPCTSLPQIPQAPTRINTSPVPAVGTGTSAISNCRYFDNNSTFIGPSVSALAILQTVLTLTQLVLAKNVLRPSHGDGNFAWWRQHLAGAK